MSRFTTICLQALLAPAGFWQSRGGGARDSAAQHPVDGPSPAERLERIGMYARAGYFHMGCALDMMSMVGEIPSD